jgi:hypothetical protein
MFEKTSSASDISNLISRFTGQFSDEDDSRDATVKETVKMKPETARLKNCPQKYSPTLSESQQITKTTRSLSANVVTPQHANATAEPAASSVPRLNLRRDTNSSSTSNISLKSRQEPVAAPGVVVKNKPGRPKTTRNELNGATAAVVSVSAAQIVKRSNSRHSSSTNETVKTSNAVVSKRSVRKEKAPTPTADDDDEMSVDGESYAENESDEDENETDEGEVVAEKSLVDEELLDTIDLEYLKLQPAANGNNSAQTNRKDNLCVACELPCMLIECQGRIGIFVKFKRTLPHKDSLLAPYFRTRILVIFSQKSENIL